MTVPKVTGRLAVPEDRLEHDYLLLRTVSQHDNGQHGISSLSSATRLATRLPPVFGGAFWTACEGDKN